MAAILIVNRLSWMAMALPLNSHVGGEAMDEVEALGKRHGLVNLRATSLGGVGCVAAL